MVRVIVIPRGTQKLYGAMVKKEVSLRRSGKGTLHRSAGKHRGIEKWSHKNYKGWVWFEECLGGVVVAEVKSQEEGEEDDLLRSFLAFLHRHFRPNVASMTVSYGDA